MSIRKEKIFLKNQLDDVYKNYEEAAEKIRRNFKEPEGLLDAQVGIINNDTKKARKIISALYKFLLNFNKIETPITVFDLNVEPLYTMELWDVKTNYSIEKIFRELESGLGKRKKNEAVLQKAQNEIESFETECNNDITKRKNHLALCKEILEIAEIYSNCITLVNDTITEMIIPELKAVLCFFYADAMKETLRDKNKIPLTVEPHRISTYQNTLYHKHYLFVKNTADFYKFICRVFTKTVIKNLVESESNMKTAKSERNKLKNDYNDLEQRVQEIRDNRIITEDKSND